jgi:hypothetical protein
MHTRQRADALTALTALTAARQLVLQIGDYFLLADALAGRGSIGDSGTDFTCVDVYMQD